MQEGAPDVRKRPLSGPANHVYQVFRGLEFIGHDMRFLALYDGSIWRSEDLEDFETVNTPRSDQGFRRQVERVTRGIQSRLHLPYANYFGSQRFSEACQSELADCDLIYERMGWMGYGGGFAAKKLGIPLVLEANNGDFITELERRGIAPRGWHRWLAVTLMRASVHRSTHVVATGAGHKDRFVDWWQVANSKVTVIENGSEVVGLLDREQLLHFQKRSNLEGPIKMVWVGSFDPWQGVQILISAFIKALDQIPGLSLTLVGDGPQFEMIKRQIQSSGFEEKIKMTGRLNIQEMAMYLAQSDIGVAPYCGWMEYSGLKLFDYKSAGLAIIASGQDGQPATIRNEDTGLIVPPCDEDELCNAICRLASDRVLRQKLGVAARFEAEKFHGWDHTVTLLDQTFSRVMAA